MRRPAASGVSALWGFVANGRQAVQAVSFSPSEIPYGGFSPVRLQIGRQPQPSPSRRMARQLIGGPSPSGHRFNSPFGQSPHGVGVEASSLRTLRSRGPWLGVGLFCPVASSLTMASSEALGLSRRVMFFRRRVFAEAEAQRFPNLSRMSFDPCRLPYPGGPGGLRLL